MLITHDPDLIKMTANRLCLVANCQVTPFAAKRGIFAGYKAVAAGRSGWPIEVRRRWRRPTTKPTGGPLPIMRHCLGAAEAKARIKKLTVLKAAIEVQLANPSVYVNPTEHMIKLQKSVRDIKRPIVEAEHNWQSAQASLKTGRIDSDRQPCSADLQKSRSANPALPTSTGQ